MTWIYIVTLLILSYLIGSFSSAVFIGKLFYHTDVREHGSKNAGATNTLRVLGTKAGVIVLLIDVLKGFLAVQLFHFLPENGLSTDHLIIFKIALAVMAVLGHVFPIYTHFKGGKGIATSLGISIALFPTPLILILIAVFFIIFLLSRYVSLGSISVAILLPILSFFAFNLPLPLIIFSVLIMVLVIITHRKNIDRLLKGEESKIYFNKKSKS